MQEEDTLLVEHAISPDIPRQPQITAAQQQPAVNPAVSTPESQGEAEENTGDINSDLYNVLPDALSASEAAIPLPIPLLDGKPERTPEEEEVPHPLSAPHPPFDRAPAEPARPARAVPAARRPQEIASLQRARAFGRRDRLTKRARLKRLSAPPAPFMTAEELAAVVDGPPDAPARPLLALLQRLFDRLSSLLDAASDDRGGGEIGRAHV